MSKTIALIGHCGPDSSYLQMSIKSALKDARIITLQDEADLTRSLEENSTDLMLINRVLDYGFNDDSGVALIARIRQASPNQKTMLVSNYDDAQQQAVAAGALPGFGKKELGTPRVVELLKSAVTPQATQSR